MNQQTPDNTHGVDLSHEKIEELTFMCLKKLQVGGK